LNPGPTAGTPELPWTPALAQAAATRGAMPGDPARSTPPAPTTAALDLLLTAQIAVAWAGRGPRRRGAAARLVALRPDQRVRRPRPVRAPAPPHLPLGLVPGGPRGRSPRRRRAARAGPQPRRRHLPVQPRLRPRRARRGAPPDPQARRARPGGRAARSCAPVLTDTWDPAAFTVFSSRTARPTSRWSRSAAASSATSRTALGELVHRLVAALHPLAPAYPLPHYRSAK
jgi:hypothetical protein